MNIAVTRFGTSVLLSLAILTFVGCGNSDVRCGSNTTNESGVCRPADGAYSCGAGTTVNSEGNCVIDDSGCGPNLVFNASAGRCVPDREECRDGSEFDPESGLCEAAVGCGEDTTLEAGTCRPDTSALCGSGAVQYDTESEECVVATGACGAGTELSAQGTCVANVSACGDGLALSEDGECVPTDEVCSDGTTFDADAGLCLPSTRCQQGDVVLNADSGPGICVSPAEKLAENVDVREQETPGPAHNDPALGGTPLDLGSISQGNATTFAGTISAASDRDNDGSVEQDRDGFTFTADAGTWVELSVQSLGLPAPWFEVTGPNNFRRASAIGRDAARQLVLPYDGTYTVSVAPEAAVTAGTDAGPFGQDDWEYVGELSGIQAPFGNLATLSTGSSTSGRLPTLEDNVYELTGGSSGGLVNINVNSVGADSEALVQVWSDPSTLTRVAEVSTGDTIRTVVPSGSNPLVAIDWSMIRGEADAYTISAEQPANAESLGTISSGSTATSATRDINPGDQFVYAAQLPAEHVVEITHTNNEDEDLDVTLEDGIGQELAVQESVPARPNLNAAGDDDEGYFWVETAGLYTITVETDDPITGHELEVATHAPIQAGAGGPGSTLTANVSSPAGQNRSNWFIFDVQQPVTAEVSVDVTPSSGSSADADAALYDLKRRPVNLRSDAGELRFERGTDSFGIGPVGLRPGSHLVRVGLEDIISNVDLSVDLTSPPALEQEPNDTPGNATTLSPGTSHLGELRGAGAPSRDPTRQLPSADIDLYAFNLGQPLSADTTAVIRVEAERDTEDAWSCSAISPSGNTIDSVADRDAGCLLHVPGDASGNYGVRVDLSADNWRRYEITYTQESALVASEPNDESGDAVSLGLSNQNPEGIAVGRISSADPIDRLEATIPSGISGSPQLVARLSMTGPDAATQTVLDILDGSGATVDTVGPGETFVTDVSGGDDFEFAIANARGSALTDVDGEYRLTVLAYEPDISRTSTPGATIPDSPPSSGSLDTVSISQACASVTRVTLDVTVSGHPARTYLEVSLTGPNGTTQTLLEPVDNPANHVFEPLSGNIPLDYPPVNPLSVYNGSGGQGDWSISIVDNSFAFGGTLDSWTVNLNCQ